MKIIWKSVKVFLAGIFLTTVGASAKAEVSSTENTSVFMGKNNVELLQNFSSQFSEKSGVISDFDQIEVVDSEPLASWEAFAAWGKSFG